MHEAKMHEKNSFVTLTYNNENCPPKLDYSHFQGFMKRLRDEIFRNVTESHFGSGYWASLSDKDRKLHLKKEREIYEQYRIGFFVTGEYGDLTKRPHWHALIFNWRPEDLVYKYRNERGDTVYRSDALDRLWGKGHTEIGSVTFESAGYVARYAAKKLVHGVDGSHEYNPISKKSSKSAIGKRWLERYWRDAFSTGSIVLESGVKCSIPRYYEKWLQKNHFEEWQKYTTGLKVRRLVAATLRASQEKFDYIAQVEERGRYVTTPNEHRKKVIDEKFKRLQSYLKKEL